MYYPHKNWSPQQCGCDVTFNLSTNQNSTAYVQLGQSTNVTVYNYVSNSLKHHSTIPLFIDEQCSLPAFNVYIFNLQCDNKFGVRLDVRHSSKLQFFFKTNIWNFVFVHASLPLTHRCTRNATQTLVSSEDCWMKRENKLFTLTSLCRSLIPRPFRQ